MVPFSMRGYIPVYLFCLPLACSGLWAQEQDEPIPAFRSSSINQVLQEDPDNVWITSQNSGGDGGNSTDGGDGANVRIFEKELQGHVLIESRGGYGRNGGNAGHIRVYFVSRPPSARIVIDAEAGLSTSENDDVRDLSGRPGEAGSIGLYQLSGMMFDCLSKLSRLPHSFDPMALEECRLAVEENYQAGVLDEPQGEIHLNANGGDGVNAKSPSRSGQSAAAGASGSNGGRIISVLTQLPASSTMSARGGHGGDGANGADGGDGANGANGFDASFSQAATRGGDGVNGMNAGHGSSGGHGGYGGRVSVVRITNNPSPEEPSWLELFEFDLSGGLGGLRGFGGDGGTGGRGGVGGKLLWSEEHLPNGRHGVPGQDGVDGFADGEDRDAGRLKVSEYGAVNREILNEFMRDRRLFPDPFDWP